MHPFFIVLIVISALLVFLFSVYLYLIMPAFKRKAQIKKFARNKYAHRGLHGDGAAENSLTAFSRAVDAGYGIELDVRLSRDGELVVFHDDTLDRVVGTSGRVDSYDYSELKDMHLSETEDTVPLFSDVLSLVDGKVPLLIELKESAGKYAVTKKTLEILEGYKGEYVIESFNPLALKLVKKKKPEVLRAMLIMNYMKEKKHRKPVYFFLQLLAFNVICRPDAVACDHRFYNSFALRLCRMIYLVTTIAWTTVTKEEEELAYRHKFDSVIFENYIPGENR